MKKVKVLSKEEKLKEQIKQLKIQLKKTEEDFSKCVSENDDLRQSRQILREEKAKLVLEKQKVDADLRYYKEEMRSAGLQLAFTRGKLEGMREMIKGKAASDNYYKVAAADRQGMEDPLNNF